MTNKLVLNSLTIANSRTIAISTLTQLDANTTVNTKLICNTLLFYFEFLIIIYYIKKVFYKSRTLVFYKCRICHGAAIIYFSKQTNKTQGIPPYWSLQTEKPPHLLSNWIGQFFSTVGLNENWYPMRLLKASREINIDPPPKPEQLSNTQTERKNRLVRATANIRQEKKKQQSKTKGP